MTYTYTDYDGDRLRIHGGTNLVSVTAVTEDRRRFVAIDVENKDVPAVALELLKAAGHVAKDDYNVTPLDSADATRGTIATRAQLAAGILTLAVRGQEMADGPQVSENAVDALWSALGGFGSRDEVRAAVARLVSEGTVSLTDGEPYTIEPVEATYP